MKQHQLDIADAIRPSYQSRTPLLLRNLIANCDAIHFWRSLDYWRAAVGEDAHVEVEVGRSYNSGKRVPIRFGDYLDYLKLSVEREDEEFAECQQGGKEKEQEQEQTQKQRYGETEQEEVAYLAQNELFGQVLHDIPIPHFCDNSEHKIGEGKLYHNMLWMGPRHTVSPLHFDPLDNLLMQVVGWKRVLLFPPDDQDSEQDGEGKRTRISSNEPTWHYAGANGNQYNTSGVDIENPDHGQFPNFKALAPTPFECILGPSDALFIPKRWWHHVRSLEMSVSANVWWR